ncbi:hypothetical protein AB9N12_16970 [Bacteroides sp. AN502(2024)]|uniref:hypothetical protein n=1 Tax=Bacteroides sp. AN502(2024) TaxID=3160599 RepID=UPI003513036C
MKRYLSVMMLLVCSVALFAQQEVTRFLGIPVDGEKSEMIQKLKEKGFKNDAYNKDALVGNFNGSEVKVFIDTNNDKVCRIMVCDANLMNAGDIRIRFNTLCRQFQKNEKYIPASSSDYTLSEEEDISYEMTVNHKRYEAGYYQRPAADFSNEITTILQDKYSEEVLKNPTEEQQKEMVEIAASYMFDKYSNNFVWFMIHEFYGEYYIAMYYENRYNMPNGEDL